MTPKLDDDELARLEWAASHGVNLDDALRGLCVRACMELKELRKKDAKPKKKAKKKVKKKS